MKKRLLSLALTLAMLCSVFCMGSVTASSATLPESYTSAYTPARNQGNSNLCWAFSTMAVLEANILKNSASYTDAQLAAMIPSGVYDKSKPLSEQIDLFEKAMAYYHYNVKTTDLSDPTRGDYADEPGKAAYSKGGHANEQTSVLARWSGLSSYNDTTARGGEPLYYNYNSLWVDDGVPETERYNAVAHLQRTVQIPDNAANRNELIKQNVMDCGAVAAGYGSVSGGYGRTTDAGGKNITTYFSKDATGESGGHAIAIVGWDDHFSKDNFKGGAKPANDGAWLCKNSYGDQWETMNGLFWMSYEEPTLNYAAAYYLEPPTNYDNNYQYDGLANNSGSSTFDTQAVNVFTAKGDEVLEAVSFYPTSIGGAASNYTVNIYKDFHDFDGISSTGFEEKAFTSQPVCTMTGTTTDFYITLRLTTPVQLSAGERYAVAVENTCNGTYYYKTDNFINSTGESYLVRLDRDTIDLYNGGKGLETSKSFNGYYATVGANAAIKAFTTNLKTYRTQVSYDIAPSYTVTIPENAELNKTCVLSAEHVVLDMGKQLEISVSGEVNESGKFTVTNGKTGVLSYQLTDTDQPGTEFTNGATVLTVDPTDSANGSITLNLSEPLETVKFSGGYSGTLTFTVAVKEAP